jgi:hypothetical protein
MRKTSIAENDQSNSQTWRYRFRKMRIVTLCVAAAFSCTVSNAGTSRLYPPANDESGALILAQVIHLATRQEILALGPSRQILLDSGLKDSDFKDGSVAVGRITCCHQSTDEGTAIWFYVPPDVPAMMGDIVAVRMGRKASKQDPGAINTATEVREKPDSSNPQCKWDPPNESYWGRVLYCSWMQAEGWTLKGGLHKTWLKFPADAKTQ